MPIIDQEELNKLNSQLQSHREDIEDIEDENTTIKKHRLILLITSIVLFLLLFTGILTYFFSPSTFMSVSKFEAQGYKVMPTDEYVQIKEILESQSTDSLGDDEFAENDSNDFDSETSDNESDVYEEESNQDSLSDKIIYAVQVAALENQGIELYSNNLIQFSEIRNDDFYKYSLGAFETLEEAQQFRKELVKLGFDDAFVASYQNGNRLKIEEAW